MTLSVYFLIGLLSAFAYVEFLGFVIKTARKFSEHENEIPQMEGLNEALQDLDSISLSQKVLTFVPLIFFVVFFWPLFALKLIFKLITKLIT